jgi:hypothetical protein
MAHWAGSGPRGKKCRNCQHWQRDTRKRGVGSICEQFKRMVGYYGKELPGDIPACKYFEKISRKGAPPRGQHDT